MIHPNPLDVFKHWYQAELALSKAAIPSACCLSTIGLDGYPNARFVSLKKVTGDHFMITGTTSSRKGLEITATNKVALTFWWTKTQRQVRVQGLAAALSADLADAFFHERDRPSQAVSIISDQGKEIEHPEELRKLYDDFLTANTGVLKRPDNFGGYAIAPTRIEFMAFKSTRLHERTCYEIAGEDWIVRLLQP